MYLTYVRLVATRNYEEYKNPYLSNLTARTTVSYFAFTLIINNVTFMYDYSYTPINHLVLFGSFKFMHTIHKSWVPTSQKTHWIITQIPSYLTENPLNYNTNTNRSLLLTGEGGKIVLSKDSTDSQPRPIIHAKCCFSTIKSGDTNSIVF